MRSALITGITGQDGSYLAELLLEKGYSVHGLVRRSSNQRFDRINHILKDVNLHYGDMSDEHSIQLILEDADPDEVYNLAAESFVATSFVTPSYSIDVAGMGALRILNCIKTLRPDCKFYQAGSSEQFGDVREKPQTELTPFYPCSPYACGKVLAFDVTRNYRESYKLFACNGILFNHETVTYGTPIIIKIDGKIDILPIGDVVRFKTGVIFNLEEKRYQEGKPILDLEVWDKNGWTKVKFASGYPHIEQKNPKIINGRNFTYSATGSHICFLENGEEKRTDELKLGDKFLEIEYPSNDSYYDVSVEEAEFLGMLVGDGNLDRGNPRFTNKDKKIKSKFIELWSKITINATYKKHSSKSGFTNEEIGQVICKSVDGIDFDIYTNDISPFGHKNKKVPAKILNSSREAKKAFLEGYNKCDGLKKNSCAYEFKNFKTNSPTLAAGLLFLVNEVTGQRYNITVEESWKWGKQQFYYSVNLLSDKETNLSKYHIVKKLLSKNISQHEINRTTKISRTFIRKVKNGYVPSNSHHLELCHNEIKKIINIPNYSGWFFDLETESGTFHAGVGNGLLHNSPRRGIEFVTRKITQAVARIKHGDDKPLELGNLDSVRDWGHAKDYVRAMQLMLQSGEPDDYVIATGETHTVREFATLAFKHAGMNITWANDNINELGVDSKTGRTLIKVNPQYYRPCEVNYLCGDSTKARRLLGWKPKISFSQLVEEMVEHDLSTYKV